jgi:hypothetical protein
MRLALSLSLVLVLLPLRQTLAQDETAVREQLRAANAASVGPFEQGLEQMKTRDYKSAIASFERVTHLAPTLDAGYRYLATAHAFLGEGREAAVVATRAVELKRTPENLMALAQFEVLPERGKSVTPESKQRALRLLKEANQQTNNATALFLTAELAMELRESADFKNATEQMMGAFPEKSESHYLNAILMARDNDWSNAEKEIQRAGDLGLPPDVVRQFLDSGVHRRASEWQFATYVAYVAVGWVAGLAALFVIGKFLSRLTLASIERAASAKAIISSRESALRKFYRLLIQVAGWYYYISLPFVALLLLVIAVSIFYAFFALGHLPLRLLLVVGVMTVLTIYKMFHSLFIKIPARDPGRVLKTEEAPDLWVLTRKVASDIGTRPVDEIRITPGTEVAVYERGTRKEKAKDKARRVLILGAGVLNGFRLQSFRAVLAHEYGHFTNRDTAGGDVALRVNNDMMKFAYAMALSGQAVNWNVGFLFFRVYHFIFRRISHGASRLQEILADRMAALKYGASAFEEGLTHAIRRSIEFPITANREITLAVNDGRAIQNLYALAAETATSVDAELEKALRRPTSEDDTHPSAVDRFRFVRPFGSATHVEDTSMVWDLFVNREAITMEMTASVDRAITRPTK